MTLLLLASRAVAAQATQPATLPAPAQSPKEAIARLSDALRDGDVDAIIASVDVPTGPAGNVVAAMARFDAGLAELHRAAVTVFGDDKGAAVVGDETIAAELSRSAIDSAQVKIDGDHATVTYQNPDQQIANLVKTLQGWKVKLNELDAVAATSNADATVEMFENLAAAARKTADEITLHKFHTAEKAAEGWRNRMMQVAAPDKNK